MRPLKEKKRRAHLVSLRNLVRRYPVWRRKRLTCLHGRRSDISDAESINGDGISRTTTQEHPVGSNVQRN